MLEQNGQDAGLDFGNELATALGLGNAPLADPNPSPAYNADPTLSSIQTQSSTADNPVQQASQPQDTPHTQPNQDETRFEFWQSKYNQLENEYKSFKEQGETKAPYYDIAEYLYNNPKALLALEEQLNGQPSQGNQPPKVEAPVMPTKPVKPANYSRYDAMNDPESESSKYEDAFRDYQSSLTEYMVASSEYEKRMIQEERNRQLQLQAQQQKQEQFRNSVITSGLSMDKFDDFNKVLNSPISMDPKNLIFYYNYLKGAQSGVPPQTVATQQFDSQAQRLATPPPPGGVAGVTTATPTDEDAFVRDLLLSNSRK